MDNITIVDIASIPYKWGGKTAQWEILIDRFNRMPISQSLKISAVTITEVTGLRQYLRRKHKEVKITTRKNMVTKLIDVYLLK